MNKRGVSPVIATVLLIAVVVVLGTIIFFWARGFLTESAEKDGKAVSTSCANVKFEARVIAQASQCPTSSNSFNSAIDINNIGNVPIYGAQVLEYDSNDANSNVVPLSDQPFVGGTITMGKSSYVCLNNVVANTASFRIVPKLLAERGGNKIIYTCPEKDGLTLS